MVDNNPFGTGGPKITRPPFIPAARSNVNLIDVITSTRNPSTGKFFQSKAAFDAFSEAEIGTSIGKKDGPKALQLLNKINKQSGGKGYVPISEAYKKMEESTLKTKNPKIKKAEGIKLANQLTSIQNEANKKFGKATTGPKVTWMKDTLKNAGITAKSVLKLGMKSILPALGPIGAILSVGMSKEAETGELSPEQQEEQQKYGAQYRMNRAGGGMMNMDEMTRPLQRYEHGGMHISPKVTKEALEKLKKNDSFYDAKPFIPPRDEEGNIIPFEQPKPKPFILPRDEKGNVIPFDPKEGIQLLGSKEKGRTRTTNVAGQELTEEEQGQLADIHTLTITGGELYKMKLEKLGLPTNILLPMDKHIEIMDALRKLTEQGKGTYILDPDDPSSDKGMTFATGGMMNMDEMIRPLGYAHGGMHYEHGGLHGPAGATEMEILKAEMARSKAPKVPSKAEEKILDIMGPVPGQFMENIKRTGKDIGSRGLESLSNLFVKKAEGSELSDPFPNANPDKLFKDYVDAMNLHILSGGDPKVIPIDIQDMRLSLVIKGVLD